MRRGTSDDFASSQILTNQPKIFHRVTFWVTKIALMEQRMLDPRVLLWFIWHSILGSGSFEYVIRNANVLNNPSVRWSVAAQKITQSGL
jgi:hypothetical protein